MFFSFIHFWLLAVLAGDQVSVYCDVKKKCRKGMTKHFDGEKFYLGNGKALFSRWQLFEENDVEKSEIQVRNDAWQHESPRVAASLVKR